MSEKFVAFDLEIARIVPNFNEWQQHRPLGISCAATLDEKGNLRFWYGLLADGTPAPQMSTATAAELMDHLCQQQENGRPVVTWNGAAFDFDVLGEEAGNPNLAAAIAREHVDLMVAFACVRGHRLSLKKAALACGSFKGAAGVTSGADAPVLWANGEFARTLAYLEQDVRATADVTRFLFAHRGFTWISSAGDPTTFQLPSHVVTLRDMTVIQALSWPEPVAPNKVEPIRRSDFLAWTSACPS